MVSNQSEMLHRVMNNQATLDQVLDILRNPNEIREVAALQPQSRAPIAERLMDVGKQVCPVCPSLCFHNGLLIA